MVWCGVVWCGVVWCGVVWCGVVWCGVVWCGVVWCGVVCCGVVWCGVVCPTKCQQQFTVEPTHILFLLLPFHTPCPCNGSAFLVSPSTH